MNTGKLGLIAGGGSLPREVAEHCARAGRAFFVIRLAGFADEMDDHPGVTLGVGEFGKCMQALKEAGCESICFAGKVSRPDFSALRADLRGIKALPGLISAARQGDDALLRRVLEEFSGEGFVIEGVHEVTRSLTLPAGLLGRHGPAAAHMADVERAAQIARQLGRMDIGQGAVVCRGLVLALEAQEGTDAMLERVAGLPSAIRGTAEGPFGVLAKMPKPIQELRIDLPTIGPATLQQAARAGLAGIVGEAGRLLVVDRAELITLADSLGLFVLGIDPE